jgi:hypothetical protein
MPEKTEQSQFQLLPNTPENRDYNTHILALQKIEADLITIRKHMKKWDIWGNIPSKTANKIKKLAAAEKEKLKHFTDQMRALYNKIKLYQHDFDHMDLVKTGLMKEKEKTAERINIIIKNNHNSLHHLYGHAYYAAYSLGLFELGIKGNRKKIAKTHSTEQTEKFHEKQNLYTAFLNEEKDRIDHYERLLKHASKYIYEIQGKDHTAYQFIFIKNMNKLMHQLLFWSNEDYPLVFHFWGKDRTYKEIYERLYNFAFHILDTSNLDMIPRTPQMKFNHHIKTARQLLLQLLHHPHAHHDDVADNAVKRQELIEELQELSKDPGNLQTVKKSPNNIYGIALFHIFYRSKIIQYHDAAHILLGHIEDFESRIYDIHDDLTLTQQDKEQKYQQLLQDMDQHIPRNHHILYQTFLVQNGMWADLNPNNRVMQRITNRHQELTKIIERLHGQQGQQSDNHDLTADEYIKIHDQLKKIKHLNLERIKKRNNEYFISDPKNEAYCYYHGQILSYQQALWKLIQFNQNIVKTINVPDTQGLYTQLPQFDIHNILYQAHHLFQSVYAPQSTLSQADFSHQSVTIRNKIYHLKFKITKNPHYNQKVFLYDEYYSLDKAIPYLLESFNHAVLSIKKTIYGLHYGLKRTTLSKDEVLSLFPADMGTRCYNDLKQSKPDTLNPYFFKDEYNLYMASGHGKDPSDKIIPPIPSFYEPMINTHPLLPLPFDAVSNLLTSASSNNLTSPPNSTSTAMDEKDSDILWGRVILSQEAFLRALYKLQHIHDLFDTEQQNPAINETEIENIYKTITAFLRCSSSAFQTQDLPILWKNQHHSIQESWADLRNHANLMISCISHRTVTSRNPQNSFNSQLNKLKKMFSFALKENIPFRKLQNDFIVRLNRFIKKNQTDPEHQNRQIFYKNKMMPYIKALLLIQKEYKTFKAIIKPHIRTRLKKQKQTIHDPAELHTNPSASYDQETAKLLEKIKTVFPDNNGQLYWHYLQKNKKITGLDKEIKSIEIYLLRLKSSTDTGRYDPFRLDLGNLLHEQNKKSGGWSKKYAKKNQNPNKIGFGAKNATHDNDNDHDNDSANSITNSNINGGAKASLEGPHYQGHNPYQGHNQGYNQEQNHSKMQVIGIDPADWDRYQNQKKAKLIQRGKAGFINKTAHRPKIIILPPSRDLLPYELDIRAFTSTRPITLPNIATVTVTVTATTAKAAGTVAGKYKQKSPSPYVTDIAMQNIIKGALKKIITKNTANPKSATNIKLIKSSVQTIMQNGMRNGASEVIKKGGLHYTKNTALNLLQKCKGMLFLLVPVQTPSTYDQLLKDRQQLHGSFGEHSSGRPLY